MKMKKNKIFFVINPLHSKKVQKLKNQIKKKFASDNYKINLLISEYKGHAIKLSKKAVDKKATIVVACGGDGTINEVGQTLARTSIPLGVIPLGSGNSFARHFNISRKISIALDVVIENYTTIIDIGKINNTFFFSNFGLGIEAKFIHEYSKKEIHGFLGYIISFFTTISSYKKLPIKIEINKKEEILNPYLFLISNTSQQGYNFSITPKAITNDGIMNLVYTENSSLLILFYNLIISLIIKKNLFQKLKYSKLKQIKITNKSNKPFCLQVDGEILNINKKELFINVISKSLKVIVPKKR